MLRLRIYFCVASLMLAGLGFTVFGQCVTKRTLWLFASSLYSVIAVAGPAVLGDIGLSSSGCHDAGGQLAHCPFGWEFADDSCFRLYGAQSSDEAPIEAEHMVTSDFGADASLTWADAELACSALGVGTHLATLASKEHQRIATKLSIGQEYIVRHKSLLFVAIFTYPTVDLTFL